MPKELIIFNNILYFLGGVSLLLFLYFRMKDAFQVKEKRKTTRDWFRKIWETIDRLKIADLPIRSIHYVIHLKSEIKKIMTGMANFFALIGTEKSFINKYGCSSCLGIILLFVLGLYCWLIYWTPGFYIVIAMLILIMLLGMSTTEKKMMMQVEHWLCLVL